MENINLPMTVVFVGAVLSAGGALWVSHRQTQEAKEANNERLAFERELREKSDEIAKLNQQIAQSVTGGDSFCYIELQPTGDPSKGLLLIFHNGEAPMYDLAIGITDDTKETPPAGANILEYQKRVTRVNVGTLFPKLITADRVIDIPDSDPTRFMIHFYARNGTFMEELFLQKSVGKWNQAFRVFKTDPVIVAGSPKPEILLKEKIDEGFRLNEQGKVDWKITNFERPESPSPPSP